jgi:hypothetical protein
VTSAAAAEPASTSATRSLFFGLVDGKRPAPDFPPVQGCDGGLGVSLTPHFDEGKSAWPSGIPIGDDLHVRNFATPLFKERTEL